MDTTLVSRIANLANIPISGTGAQKLAVEFEKTLAVVDTLMQVDTAHVLPTHQVTGLQNVWREDTLALSFSQTEALQNASNTHNGYFVVPQVISE